MGEFFLITRLPHGGPGVWGPLPWSRTPGVSPPQEKRPSPPWLAEEQLRRQKAVCSFATLFPLYFAQVIRKNWQN